MRVDLLSYMLNDKEILLIKNVCHIDVVHDKLMFRLLTYA